MKSETKWPLKNKPQNDIQSELLEAAKTVLSMADPGVGGYDVPMIAMKKLQAAVKKYD